MKLGEFIEKFSHNNVIRLVYKNKGGHEVVLEEWSRDTLIEEIKRRQELIISEPDGIVRETMIANLLVGLQ